MQTPAKKWMILLSQLLLTSPAHRPASQTNMQLRQQLSQLSREEFNEFAALADSNHVIVRGLESILALLDDSTSMPLRQWVQEALAAERSRIATAVLFLSEIFAVFVEHGHEIAVIKSLDHWPDLGSDLDLYTDAEPREVCRLMQSRFNAQIAPRSWGDRLAAKWNFLLPGLPEAVEIHMGRLGQTGEQVAIASSLLERTRVITACDHPFRVSSVSDQFMISTLQRMYRHFYFRLCDIVDSTALADQNSIEYETLRGLAIEAGIWEGVATYLTIVSDFVKTYRGTGIELPKFVTDAAQFGGNRIYYDKSFLRVPILPQSARLYRSQLAGILGKGELHNGIRLSLLPWLATAAVVGQKLTGSDKGIW